ncbi:MAG TPA: rhodanese-like domain-containing protein [Candidatus Angelobacter sp.]|nr:rhodanese-like domain-containing protein [Candidatus Angelobacter sp.]
MVSVVSVPQFSDLKTRSKRFLLIDVRSPSEYATGHIPGAVNMPMEQVPSRLPDLEGEDAIVLVCQSGHRARMVAGLLEPSGKLLSILEGGTSAWLEAGLPVVTTSVTRWSLERQVRFAAGLLVLTGIVLALTTNIRWIYLVGFVGLGLAFSGISGLCPMGSLLSCMPWNRGALCSFEAPSASGVGCV